MREKRSGADWHGAAYENVRHRQVPDLQRDSTPPPRLQHLAERVHRLRPRPLHELIVELAERFGPEIIDRLERHARLDPRILRAIGGDKFPPRLAALAGGRR